MAGAARRELLVARVEHLHRPPEVHRGLDGDDVDRVRLGLRAEPAAEVRRDDPDLVGRQAEDALEAEPVEERRLTRDVQRHPPGRVIVGDEGVRLHAHVALAACDEPVLEDVVGLREAGVDVAGGDTVVRRDVALGPLVDLRGALRHCRLGLVDALDRLVGDLDRLDPAQRGLLVDRDDCRDALALVADDAVGERGLVLDERAELGLRHVLLRVDREDAGDLLGLEGVDRLDTRVRIWAAQDLAPEHPGQVHVVGVRRLARDLLAGVDARQRPSHDVVLRGGRRVLANVELARRGLDRLDDLRVAGAPAQVASDRLPDLVLGRLGVVGEERLGGHDHARRAVAALRREAVGERLLDRVERAVAGQPLDRRDLRADRLHREHEARVDDGPVEVHGARRALALVAGAFRAGELEIVTQNVDQRTAGVHQQVVGNAVDVEVDGDLVHRALRGGLTGRAVACRSTRGRPAGGCRRDRGCRPAGRRRPTAWPTTRRDRSAALSGTSGSPGSPPP